MADEPEDAGPTATKSTERTPNEKKKPPSRSKKGILKRPAAIGTPIAKGTPWTFPKNTLEDAIRVSKAIEDKNAGNPMPSHQVALAVGFRQSNDWRYLDLLRSANQYGLVNGSGATAAISLTDLGRDVVAPSSPNQRVDALVRAFRSVKDFEAVQDFYGGKRIPEDEFFSNTLTREFRIPRDRVETFARIFVENLTYLRAFAPAVIISDVSNLGETVGTSPATEKAVGLTGREPRVREFLDTCFVMMPFGQWFDRYYQEIYAPAIKEAGFEAVRADELFTTGSVMEQIWEQIEKASILLADLSGRNPNVFYELGLAHAARKPVVFTASQVEDVPFDLRHLRVIIYDVREPEWSLMLRQSITDYLRNAAKEPEKSIPHPFRKLVEEAGLATPRSRKV